MSKGYKKIQPSDNPKPFVKGQSGNPDGRPKKIYTIIKEMGYSADDMKSVFKELCWYTVNELKELFKDENKPAIVRIVSNQLWLSLSKGDMGKAREILEYTLGKPTQSSELEIKGNTPLPIINVYNSQIPLSSNEDEVKE
jgi:hypothetical protein